jgi:hypothetical protein
MITLEQLKRKYIYDPLTGIFTIASSQKISNIGKVVGGRSNGYIQLDLDGKKFYAHQLAWFYMTGEWPSMIDHVNLDRADNRFINLRIASHNENQHNKTVQKNNTSGFKGVYKARNKWSARIMVDGKRYDLGLYLTAEEAGSAYASAAKKYHKEFARI